MGVKTACFSCKREIEFSDKKIGLREECPHCGADMHSCKACDFYDVKAYNECREPSADRVTEKERANFCDYFTLRIGSASADDAAARLRAAAEALFGPPKKS